MYNESLGLEKCEHKCANNTPHIAARAPTNVAESFYNAHM